MALDKRVFTIALGVGLALAIHDSAAHAGGMMDDLAQRYESVAQNWRTTLLGYGKTLFTILAVIEFAWNMIWLLLERGNADEFIVGMTKKVCVIMLAFSVLNHAQAWIPAIMNSFQQAGAQAAGLPNISPSEVFDRGVKLGSSIFALMAAKGGFFTLTNPVLGLSIALIAFIIFASFVVIAAQLLVTMIESYICVAAGMLFLGGLGSRVSQAYAEKYFGYCISVGCKLLVIYLIIGAAQPLIVGWDQLVTPGMEIVPPIGLFFQLGGSAVVLAFVCWQIPGLAASVLSSANLNLGHAASNASAVGGTAQGQLRSVLSLGKATSSGGAAATQAGSAVAGKAVGVGVTAGAGAATGGTSIVAQATVNAATAAANAGASAATAAQAKASSSFATKISALGSQSLKKAESPTQAPPSTSPSAPPANRAEGSDNDAKEKT